MPNPLPLPVRASSAAARALGRDASSRAADALASRLLRADRTYVGADGVSLRIDPGDKFQRAMLLGRYDPTLAAVIDRFVSPGGHVLDCGSHIGYVALLLARAVGPSGSVHCFEPDPRLAERLRHNMEANAAPWVHITEAAVAARSGERLELALTDQLGWGSVGVDVWSAGERTAVSSLAVDDYVAERSLRPSFVKVDVEGTEADALLGMSRTLADGDAPLLVEWIPWRIEANGDDPAVVLSRLSDLGYAAYAPALRDGRLHLEPGTDPEHGDDVLFLKQPPT